jgi:hypothetical protein
MAKVGTLGDLEQERRVITLYCPDHHHASWPGWYLAQRYGANMPLQRFYERCRCGQCGKRADDLKVATFADGTFHDPARRCAFTPPPALAEPVRVIGALAVALCG